MVSPLDRRGVGRPGDLRRKRRPRRTVLLWRRRHHGGHLSGAADLQRAALRLPDRRLPHPRRYLRAVHGARGLSRDAAQYSSRRILNGTRPTASAPLTLERLSTGLEDRPPEVIVAIDEPDQRYQQRVALLREKRTEQTFLRLLHRAVHLAREPVAGAGQPRKHHTRVVRAAATLYEAASGQSVEHVGNIGAVDS